MGLTPDDLRELLDAFEGSTWQDMSVTVGGDSLHVSRRVELAPADHRVGTTVLPPVPPAPAAPPASPAPPAAAVSSPPAADAAPSPAPDSTAAALRPAGAGGPTAPSGGMPVPAPSVGLFWHAPSPGAPPFVQVGTRVGPEDVIGIVEVMKLMNQVPAGVAGVVTAVLVENGGMVEHGQPLVLVDPGA